MIAITIIFWLVGLFVLYLIIKWAIDGSETAENIREIRRILSRQYTNSKTIVETEIEPNENLNILDFLVDECPACHFKVQESDKECASCGLRLKY